MRECIIYLACIGVSGFIIGRLLPKHSMHWDQPPFKLFAFEDGGKCYHCLKIRAWKDKIPDMSKIFTKWMPSKKLPEAFSEESVTLMLQETCIAELVHGFLALSGLYCIHIWPGAGGWILSCLFLLGNIPFIMVQRYNRPKLQRLLKRVMKSTHTPSVYQESEEC